MNPLYENLMEYPLISGIYDTENIETILNTRSKIIFLLGGNIFNLKDITTRIKDKGKSVFIFVDSIDGFSKDTWGLEYMVKNIELDGIISNKPSIIKMSRDMGVFTIQRALIYNTRTLEETLISLKSLRPHAVEILPGLMPHIIEKVYKETKLAIISNGLMRYAEDVRKSIDAGAVGVCTSNLNLLNTYE